MQYKKTLTHKDEDYLSHGHRGECNRRTFFSSIFDSVIFYEPNLSHAYIGRLSITGLLSRVYGLSGRKWVHSIIT